VVKRGSNHLRGIERRTHKEGGHFNENVLRALCSSGSGKRFGRFGEHCQEEENILAMEDLSLANRSIRRVFNRNLRNRGERNKNCEEEKEGGG